MNSSYYMPQLESLSSFEFQPYPSVPAMPRELPKKPRQQSKDKSVIIRPQYPDDVPGPINFDISINVGTGRNPWTYSKKLKRIYIPTNQTLTIIFAWSPAFQPLYLRSSLVFADGSHKNNPVQRCYAHMGSELSQNSGVGYEQLRHVFRIANQLSLYETDVNGCLSTRTLLRPEEGIAWVDYQFCCQNSCPTGINRRTTKMVFLVEDALGVVAKRSLLIQICSNPNRDKVRDEFRMTDDSKKLLKPTKPKRQPRQSSSAPPPQNNSQSPSCSDNENVYELNLQILGEDNYKAVLKYAYDVMAAQAIRTGNRELFKPHMSAILQKELDGQ